MKINKKIILKLIEGLQMFYDTHSLESNDECLIQDTLILLGSKVGIKKSEVLMW